MGIERPEEQRAGLQRHCKKLAKLLRGRGRQESAFTEVLLSVILENNDPHGVVRVGLFVVWLFITAIEESIKIRRQFLPCRCVTAQEPNVWRRGLVVEFERLEKINKETLTMKIYGS